MIGILHKRTPLQLLACFEDQGKGTKRLVGGYIDDLAALGKCIWLCRTCTPRFNSARYSYVIPHNLPTVRGDCDGCRNFGLNTMFVPHDHHDGKGIDK